MVVDMLSGVKDAVSEDTSIISVDNNLVINTSDVIDVKVYNTQGMLVASADNVSGLVQLSCDEYRGQLLIVKAGNKVAKIVIK